MDDFNHWAEMEIDLYWHTMGVKLSNLNINVQRNIYKNWNWISNWRYLLSFMERVCNLRSYATTLVVVTCEIIYPKIFNSFLYMIIFMMISSLALNSVVFFELKL